MKMKEEAEEWKWEKKKREMKSQRENIATKRTQNVK